MTLVLDTKRRGFGGDLRTLDNRLTDGGKLATEVLARSEAGW